MGTVVWSESATNDLYEIWAFIAVDNYRAADQVIDTVYERSRLLAAFPSAAEARPDLGDNVRASPVAIVVLYYIRSDEGIYVLRVIHGNRSVGASDLAPT